MADRSTYYDVLGVARGADHDTVRRAYLEAARRWHPDAFAAASPDEAAVAEQTMRKVNEAWHVLGSAPRRRAYDGSISVAARESARVQGGVRTDDGITRIDPRLLDPDFLTARRAAQHDDISAKHGMLVRSLPLVAVLVLLGGILVITAYASSNRDGAAGPATTMITLPAGPSLGAGIEGGDCVSIASGPSLIERPCGNLAAGRVIGAHQGDGSCPETTTREVALSNGWVACLGRP